MTELLRIKPHHLLDIIRDFGAGVVHQPHPYGHAVHRIARIVKEHPETVFELTAGADSICAPCRNLVESRCTDTTTSPGREVSKESWNRTIDGRIFERLGLAEGEKISALEFCRLASLRLGDLFTLYAEVEQSKTSLRRENLERGLKEYLERANPGKR
ncbi:MAG: hypothetical protein A3F83_03195 [Candidatus Glassbacteria bacterium RIFCSPLOWO2_12_FULL_58_11]|uniref:DUF1284 domain-containing protein n=2 Tax=Candidatus Glassiibacteriota TaxID=1817805 RepID=A0A1F5YYH0_9BACT|nr:MAG: hypothetical protein A2Z86_06325 [Candidatus Glassbacteria bacterium GWA2_58_10]OGG05186.1 MAG: hypothetical protein A3F83_03195 [Candidatus Glassbacteria bacterium RIFCSPLOWO2_12_FULL_58_11]